MFWQWLLILHSSVPIPEKPTVNINIIETSPTTITISWSVPTDANESEVSWELTEQTRRRRGVRNAEGGTSGRLPAKQNSYTILRLRSGTSYEVTLTVFNPAGSSFTTFTHSTTEGWCTEMVYISSLRPFLFLSYTVRVWVCWFLNVVDSCVWWCVGSGDCDCYSSTGYGDSHFHEEIPKS